MKVHIAAIDKSTGWAMGSFDYQVYIKNNRYSEGRWLATFYNGTETAYHCEGEYVTNIFLEHYVAWTPLNPLNGNMFISLRDIPPMCYSEFLDAIFDHTFFDDPTIIIAASDPRAAEEALVEIAENEA